MDQRRTFSGEVTLELKWKDRVLSQKKGQKRSFKQSAWKLGKAYLVLGMAKSLLRSSNRTSINMLNECENCKHERLGSVSICGGNAGDEAAKGSSSQITKGPVGHNKKF